METRFERFIRVGASIYFACLSVFIWAGGFDSRRDDGKEFS